MPSQIISANLDRVRQRIAAACARSGRDPSSVRLVAVTKYARLDWVRALVQAGVTAFGEARPQQLEQRVPLLDSTIHWHLIGHLQRNKARRVLPLAALIHSVDTFRLLETLERLADELELRPRVLLEVNVSGESQKHGFAADELIDNRQALSEFQRVQIAGLMTMAPQVNDPQEARPAFRTLAELRHRLSESSPQLTLPELSMGMSGDFEVAIEEGATIIRVGSSLFAGLTA